MGSSANPYPNGRLTPEEARFFLLAVFLLAVLHARYFLAHVN